MAVVTRHATADPIATDLVRLRASVGVDVGNLDALPPRARRALTVATAAGAPAVDALDGAAAADEDARRAARAVAVASAQTRAVAGGLLLAPALLVPALGRLVGADLVGFYTTPLGAAVGTVALLLLAAGAVLVTGLVRRVGRRPRPTSAARRAGLALAAAVAAGLLVHVVAAPLAGALVLRLRGSSSGPPAVPGIDEAADLTATAMAGGLPPGEALRTAALELPDLARPLRRLAYDLESGAAWTGPRSHQRDADPALERIGAVLATARDVGAPAVPTLRRLARDLRAEELARVLAAAERLPAQLTFPTALCLLPGTVVLVGAPIVHAGLTAAGA